MSRILIAEDDHSVAVGLVAILETQGHQVSLARTGPSAVAAAEGRVFDVLLTDIDLGAHDFDGYEVVSRVRARHPGIRVVVLTGETDIDTGRLPLGTEVLRKPQHAERILAAVELPAAA